MVSVASGSEVEGDGVDHQVVVVGQGVSRYQVESGGEAKGFLMVLQVWEAAVVSEGAEVEIGGER